MNNTPYTNRRMDVDILKLIEKHEVKLSGNKNEITVEFHGPEETPYEGGVWTVLVTLPDNYPFKSPSIGFINKVYHPNIDLQSGSVCLDVINQKWSPLYNLSNIFDTFLPLLLTYPEPEDPLNANAAALLISDREQFNDIVRSHVAQYASTSSNMKSADYKEQHKDDDELLSELSDYENYEVQ